MDLLTIRTNIKNSLYEDGVHRSDDFIDLGINEGYKLCSVLALFDERRTSLNVTGSRNFNALPTDDSAECIVPLYVANAHTGHRINPVSPDVFEFYQSEWEGVVDSSGDALYYTVLSPYHSAQATIVLCPIQNIGNTQLIIIGAFVPNDMSSDSDEPRMTEAFQDVLFHYGRFYVLSGEPGLVDLAQDAYQNFIFRLNALIQATKSRFPSGRDYEPKPVEFQYSSVTTQEREPVKETKSESK